MNPIYVDLCLISLPSTLFHDNMKLDLNFHSIAEVKLKLLRQNA